MLFRSLLQRESRIMFTRAQKQYKCSKHSNRISISNMHATLPHPASSNPYRTLQLPHPSFEQKVEVTNGKPSCGPLNATQQSASVQCKPLDAAKGIRFQVRCCTFTTTKYPKLHPKRQKQLGNPLYNNVGEPGLGTNS